MAYIIITKQNKYWTDSYKTADDFIEFEVTTRNGEKRKIMINKTAVCEITSANVELL